MSNGSAFREASSLNVHPVASSEEGNIALNSAENCGASENRQSFCTTFVVRRPVYFA